MKKLILFTIFVLIISFGVYSIAAQETSTEESTYDTVTNEHNVTVVNKYYYTDYQDLIDQVYEDVYNDLYNEFYNQIAEGVRADLYQEMTLALTEKMNKVIYEANISLDVDDFQQQIYDVIALADNSVLGVASYLGEEYKGVGSGIIYRYDDINQYYYIITNHHVVKDGNNFHVIFSDGKEYISELIGYDIEVDIAILRFKAIDQTNIQISPLGDSDLVTKGNFVISVGNPQGLGFYGSTTLGIVSGLSRKLDKNQYIDYIQHDSAINPGNSGGPIYNFSGEVIGVNVSKLANTDIEGMGFAIPINLVKRIIERIEADNLPQFTIMPRLGASYYEVIDFYNAGQVSVVNLNINGVVIPSEITLTLPIGVNKGFLVYLVPQYTTLSDSGIKSGDIIVKINDYELVDQASYYEYLYENFESGDSVTLYYYSLDHNTLEYDETLKSVTVEFK